MRTYNPEQPLVSIHIPKAGGTSFRKVLQVWFKERYLRHYFDEKNNTMPQTYPFHGPVCIHGHFNKTRQFGVEHYYPQAKQFITLLRDPFEILVSRYFFDKNKERLDTAYRNGRALVLDDDIQLYLEKQIHNPGYHPNILHYMPVPVTLENYKAIFEEYFVHVGVVDYLQESVDCLSRKLGFPSLPVQHANRTPRDKSVAPELRDAFIESHPLEYAMYAYALENYHR